MPNLSHPDRRTTQDRRSKPTSPLSPSSLFGARAFIRRQEDRVKQRYVDRYSLRAVSAILLTIILSIADATFTLKLVSMGAKEINPLMDFFLKFGPLPFLFFKYIINGTCLIWLLINKNYTILGK
ncbi:MAG: DUF5658 family protein, partial [bacterium]